MNIAVIGAGVVGTCTAYELALDGHRVTVYEKCASIAEGASFANGCLLSPSLTQALAHPRWPGGAMTVLHRFFQSARIKTRVSLSDLQWLCHWSQSLSSEDFLAKLAASHALLAASLGRLQAVVQQTGIAFDRGAGQMLLLSREIDALAVAPKMKALQELGVTLKTLSPEEARKLEPGLSANAPLHSAVWFPTDEIGNCRQFSQLLKDAAIELGASFCMGKTVSALRANPKPTLAFADASPDAVFDKVIVCTGDDASGFLATLQFKGRCAPLQSYSLSLPIREPLNAPRNALFDTASQVSIARNGGRIRVSGGLEIGNSHGKNTEKAVRQLYLTLQSRFPGAANFQQGAQIWRGSSLFSCDGLPLVGATPMAGVYLNVGHGNNGWGMASGAARMVADLIGSRDTAVDAAPFNPMRFRA